MTATRLFLLCLIALILYPQLRATATLTGNLQPDRLTQPASSTTLQNSAPHGAEGALGQDRRLESPATTDGDSRYVENPCAVRVLSAGLAGDEVVLTVMGSANELEIVSTNSTLSVATTAVCSAGECRVKLPSREPVPVSLRFDQCPAITIGASNEQWADPQKQELFRPPALP